MSACLTLATASPSMNPCTYASLMMRHNAPSGLKKHELVALEQLTVDIVCLSTKAQGAYVAPLCHKQMMIWNMTKRVEKVFFFIVNVSLDWRLQGFSFKEIFNHGNKWAGG